LNLTEKLLIDLPGKDFFMLANEAIARGVIESGVGVVSAYPGTPSSEISDALYQCAPIRKFYMEFSTNEKVAMEVAGAAALSGVRSFTPTKHVGLNVSIDTLMCFAYVGVDAGMIVLSADDVGPWSSQNEQDNRCYSNLATLPMLEPSTPQEAKDMVVEGYKISEQLNEPVIVRTTTRVNHTSGNVTFGTLTAPKLSGAFKKQADRFILSPTVAKKRHEILLQRFERAKRISEETNLTFVEGEDSGSKDFGIITSGVSYNYVKEALNELDLNFEILKLGMTNPLPEGKIARFLANHDNVIVIEELEPYLEHFVKATANEYGINAKILAKRDGLFPRFGELDPRLVLEGLAKAAGKKVPFDFQRVDQEFEKVKSVLPKRPPVLCPGCPHRATFYAIRVATGGKALYPNDIGCYGIVSMPPLETDTVFCMGSGVGMASGFSIVTDQPIVATLGDSTFFHSGVPALINSIYNNHKFVYTILDNETTAMTGQQPHPGTGVTNRGTTEKIMPEEVAKGCGAKFVKVIDPFFVKEAVKTFREALTYDGVAVIISRRECALLAIAKKRKEGQRIVPCEVDNERCTGCGVCVSTLGCPAISWSGKKIIIDPVQCDGTVCGVCMQICPQKAIGVTSG
jgi:indolepyruvate ferredoxin oxidoreductase alpha subunit